MEGIFILFAIGLFIYLNSLSRRVGHLEKSVVQKTVNIPAQVEGKTTVETHTELIDHRSVENDYVSKEEANLIQVEDNRYSINDLWNWLVRDWPMKLGAVLLLLGFGWLTTYAFLNNWIGPMGRISMGLVSGLLILVLGTWRMKKSKHQGAVLLGLASSTILLTLFAARVVYAFFNPYAVLAVMSVVVLYIAFTSYKYKYLPLALLGITLGGIAPFLIDAHVTGIVNISAYLFVLLLGFIFLIRTRGWRILTPISFVLLIIYNMPFLHSGMQEKTAAIIFALLFAALFYLANIFSFLYSKKVSTLDLLTAAGSSILLLVWINLVVPDEFKSFLTVAVALAFVLGAFMIFKITKLKNPMYVYTGIALVLLGAATAFEFSGTALTIAYALEFGFLSLASSHFLKNPKVGQKMGFLLIVPILFSSSNFAARTWQNSILHEDFFALLIIGTILLGLGYYFSQLKKSSSTLTNLFFISGSFYALSLVWLCLHATTLTEDMATMSALIIYTLIGLYFYLLGKIKGLKKYLITGGILLGLVTARLLLFEIWHMEISGKIFTFFLIGTLFISTAFIGNKSKNKELK